MPLTNADADRIFYPDLQSDMLKIIAGRTTMTREEEAKADMVAGALTLGLIRWAGRQEVPRFKPNEEAATVSRTWYSLGYSPLRADDE